MKTLPPAANAQFRDYLLALGAVLAGLLLRYLLNPLLGQQGPYLILTLSIVLAAFYGGFGPALFATLLSTVIGTYLFVAGGAGLEKVLEPANIGRTLLFFVIGLSIGFVGGRLKASRGALAETVRQLRASNQAKDRAMATLGHEIRNPLAALQAAQHLLKLCPDDAQRVIAASEVIQRQVAHMQRMAEDLLDLSSIMHAEFFMKSPRPVDLHQVLQQSLEQSSPLIAKKGHQLRTDLSSQPAEVVGDATRLVQVFANLLNNAAKYTDPGGKLVLSLERSEPGMVSVSVRDNGIGMQPGSIDDLFEPFVQAPGAASNAEGGLGLGLAVVKKIVTIHGGEVRAHSPGLGQGSTVTVRLPLAPSAR
jgi:signal transduction histidine kinase